MSIFKKIGQYLLQSFFLSAVVSLTLNVVAKDVMTFDAEALEMTLRNYNDAQYRKQNMGRTAAGQFADKKVQELMGSPENAQEMYRVAGVIFQEMAQESGGDFSKLKAIMKKTQGDPVTFYNSLTPQQKSLITGLKERVEAKQGIRHK